MLRRVFSFALLLGISVSAAAASPPAQDPRAVAIINQSLQAMGGGRTAFIDVTLEAMVTYTAGSDLENGTATLEAKGNRESRVVLNLDGGERHEVRQGSTGSWTGPDGQAHSVAFHNTFTDASWFFPALSLQAVLTEPQLIAAYVGPETHDSISAQHLRISRLISAPDAATTTLIQQLSTIDLYLDATTYLPVAMDFNVHPDNNLGTNIPIEIQFGDYRPVGGVKVPFHIQKLLQGTLSLDLNVSGAAINSGVSDSDFMVSGAKP